jgi:signal transduction histidine kinase
MLLMKPKYGWIYLGFIVSLAVLITVTLLYYRQSNRIKNFHDEQDLNYSVFRQFIALKEAVQLAESEAYGFMVSRDSSLLMEIQSIRPTINNHIDTLRNLLGKDDNRYRKLILMNSTLSRRINTLNRNLYRISVGDTVDIVYNIIEGQRLSKEVRKEMEEIQQIGIYKVETIRAKIKANQDISPVYFNAILIFSGVLTFSLFVLIVREMRMRLRYQVELEKRINELNQSTAELEQFTFVASHDLQEPLRKIRTFSDRLVLKHKPQMNEEAGRIIDRIDASAHRMQDMIQDMVSFTNLVNRKDKSSRVDLNLIINSVHDSLKEQIAEKNATIRFDALPVINGYADQLFLLFRSLMENSIKFNEPGRSLEITIRWIRVEGRTLEGLNVSTNRNYHLVTFRDNGIGFNNEFASKIFMIFQRLHSQESHYHGKGIGLAIAQRVMTNHNGIISARGVQGEGATFSLYFPIDE